MESQWMESGYSGSHEFCGISQNSTVTWPISDSSQSGFSISENPIAHRKCNRKRKIKPNAEVVQRQESCELMDDGYMWRKYGQKDIQKYKYPRSYFRCTYWEEGCEAKKRVQQISDNPPVYRTTCLGHHTCENSVNDSRFGLDHLDGESSNMIRFDKFDQSEEYGGDSGKVIGDDCVIDRSQEEGFPVGESWPSDDCPMVDPFDFGDPMFGLTDPWFFRLINEIQPMEQFLGAE